MTVERGDRFSFSSWAISLALHAAAVALALAFAAQIKPVLQENVFTWKVALVEDVHTDSTPEQAEPTARSVQPMARVTPPPPVDTMPETVVHRVAPQQTVQMVHPVIEPVRPIGQEVEPPPRIEQTLDSPQPMVEQKIVEVVKPAEPVVMAKEPEPVQHAEPIIGQAQPVSAVISAEPFEPRSTDSATQAPVPSQSYDSQAMNAAPAAGTVVSPAPEPALSETPPQVVKTPAQASEAKADHRWLTDSLWRRVTELKHYPSSARLNGQEGKVVLKAVIRSDGQLAHVSVQKSSGYPILDAAAMEAVKLACPLQMKHAIGKPEIVVSLPIVYSLAN